LATVGGCRSEQAATVGRRQPGEQAAGSSLWRDTQRRKPRGLGGQGIVCVPAHERYEKPRSRVCVGLSILVTHRRTAGRQPLGPVGKPFSRPAGVQLSHGDRVLGRPAHDRLRDQTVLHD
jgi:hypothetical protein